MYTAALVLILLKENQPFFAQNSGLPFLFWEPYVVYLVSLSHNSFL